MAPPGATMFSGDQDEPWPPEKQNQESVLLHLPLNDASTFDLERAVCSHGLFMMSPNCWNSDSRTFHRPLRLSSSPSTSLPVCVSHSSRSNSLEISVFGAAALSSEDQRSILDQVSRMLRLSDESDRVVREFHLLHERAREKGFGRVFRSPTLFEDMVKCILLCNCQWPRSLSMARALCELQLELKTPLSNNFQPKTPQKKEQKRKRSTNINNKKKNKKKKLTVKLETEFMTESQNNSTEDMSTTNPDINNSDSDFSANQIGDFPTPEELSTIDAKYLADRCKLGYRAQRIISLAQNIVNGNLKLENLEELYVQSNYDTLCSELLGINGFGPFTCANVLMCMGYFHKIPTDTETVRHLKQEFHLVYSFIREFAQLVLFRKKLIQSMENTHRTNSWHIGLSCGSTMRKHLERPPKCQSQIMS